VYRRFGTPGSSQCRQPIQRLSKVL
jgi:hypothetical protein